MVKAREPPIVPVTEPQLAALLGQVGVRTRNCQGFKSASTLLLLER